MAKISRKTTRWAGLFALKGVEISEERFACGVKRPEDSGCEKLLHS
jgi:hypothetical protein